MVKVEEPTEAQVPWSCCAAWSRSLEKHHNVRILDEGLAAAVKFSHRYLPDRQLPDKAVSVLDTACARLALGQNATPPAIEDASGRSTIAPCRRAFWSARAALGADHGERLARRSPRQKAAVEGAAGGTEGALGEGARSGRARSARCAASWKRAAAPPRRRRRRPEAAGAPQPALPIADSACAPNWPN